jgi:hypothetical protein
MSVLRPGERFEDPQPFDKAMCCRFGSGAFPCGQPYKVHVASASTRPRGPEVERRRVLCRAHYEFMVNSVQGGASGLKWLAMRAAYERLASAHLDEFQALYEAELRRVTADELPNVDPAILLPTGGEPS